MSTVGRMTHHVLVSRRRTHRRRPTLRRAHHWPSQAGAHGGDAGPDSELAGASSMLEVPSRFLMPLSDPHQMTLARTPGQVHVTTVIEGDTSAPGSHEPSVLDMPLTTLTWRDPFEWLALGWRDFTQSRSIGLFYGACFVLMGWLLLACFRAAPEYTLALSAGFLLLGPFLCLGLYQASRSIERGERPSFLASVMAWRVNQSQLAIFACVLLVLEMLWGRSAMIVFAISFEGIPDFSGSLASFFTGEMLMFVISYVVVGAIFAGLIYAISAISMPMMMDMGADAISAALTSMRLVFTQTGVMLMWGFIITLLVVMAMLPGFLGLVVVGPVLGHASWHAYKAVVTQREGAEPRQG
ncbi:MAG: DUF2189 domain-containing protein [Aquabacterium sp.]